VPKAFGRTRKAAPATDTPLCERTPISATNATADGLSRKD